MASKREYDFFAALLRASEFSVQAANMLEKTLNDFDPVALPELMIKMHTIEHEADNSKHAMNTALAKAFITPIEREDIMMLAHRIDDVTDVIEDVLVRLYMYDVKTIRPFAFKLTDVIAKSCVAMQDMMSEFHNFKKSKTLKNNIIEINGLEEEGDALYTEAMRDLFVTESDPVKLLAWNEIFERLEKCCDSCEHIANSVESVIMKNS